ncbi:ATP-binding cassette domain-containing protein [Schleiferiaceae bacterium]|jgi:ABC-type multidrug transport system ATPase subunit|nr:ATP-binding cassette domain-containing protein [Schleiferiaceae bacterium]MDB0057493.1 ATP-binding cassette domain-containing protein [Schleiferiaceae bacterium]
MIVLEGLQKKFGKQHILQDVSYTFQTGSKTVILGSNGSGKSTLIKILSGALEATEGSPVYTFEGSNVTAKSAGLHVGIAAPYVALNPMFSLKETLAFHEQFCPFPEGFKLTDWLFKAGLAAHEDKRLSTFSSGMLQRVRLLLAVANDRPLLLLDEPLSNLDAEGVQFYTELIRSFALSKTIIVGSNYQKDEYSYCTDELLLEKHY